MHVVKVQGELDFYKMSRSSGKKSPLKPDASRGSMQPRNSQKKKAMNKNLLCQHKVSMDEAGHCVNISLNQTLLLSVSFSP